MNQKGHAGIAILGLGIYTYYTKEHPSTFTETVIPIISVMIGAKLPDLDLKLKHLLPKDLQNKRYLYHRQFTHSLLLWLGIGYYSYISNFVPLFYLVLGVMTHLIADMLTGSIPIGIYGRYKKPFSRIGLNINITKQFFVKLGDILYVPMAIIGIMLYLNIFNIL